MAALNIAFEAPDNSTGAAPARNRPVDLVHLARQTMGDKALEVEVLQIFARSARACLQELSVAGPDEIHAIAHRLKGSASAIGAFPLAELAERVETSPADPTLLTAVSLAVIETENFINKLCR